MCAEDEIIKVKGKNYSIKLRVGEGNDLTQQFEGVKIFELSHMTSRDVVYVRGAFTLVVAPESTPSETIAAQQQAENEFREEYRVKVIAAVFNYLGEQGLDTTHIQIKPILINQFDGTRIL